jgi:hypothetical protein
MAHSHSEIVPPSSVVHAGELAHNLPDTSPFEF